MRFRVRKAWTSNIVSIVMGIAGAIMFFIALPSWVLMALAGAGLMAGAWLIYKAGV